MTDRATYDAIVVGSRAAGAATAMLLARLGRRVLVVDRSRYGSDTLSTHALMRAGTLQLHRWDVLDDVVASRDAARAPDSVPLRRRRRRRVDQTGGRRRRSLRAAPDRARRRPRGRRRERAGAEVRFGTTVTDLLRADDGRVVGVSGHDRGGDRFFARAPVTIGADGIHSVVARLVDAPLRRSAAGVSTLVYGYWDGVDVDGYHWYFRRRAGAGVIPTNDDRVCVFAAVALGSVDAGAAPRSLFDRTVARVAPEVAERLAGVPSSAGYRMFAGRRGWMRRPFGPGWALVGDAGYFKDPISAHGITDALRDAELLARAIGHTDSERDRMAALSRVRRATRRALGAAVRDDRRHRALPLGYGGGPATPPRAELGHGVRGRSAVGVAHARPRRRCCDSHGPAGTVGGLTVQIRLLGEFTVVVDGVATPDDGWRRRNAAALVKVLALTPRHELHREQILDALWPDLSVDDAAPRLHKAAHFAAPGDGRPDERPRAARRDGRAAPGHGDLGRCPGVRGGGRGRRADGSPGAAAGALELYGGHLLPTDLYEPWAEPVARSPPVAVPRPPAPGRSLRPVAGRGSGRRGGPPGRHARAGRHRRPPRCAAPVRAHGPGVAA